MTYEPRRSAHPVAVPPPGVVVEVGGRSREPSGRSRRKPASMASASSAPTRPRRQPPRRQRRTRQRRRPALHDSSPIHTGTVGADSRNAVHRSVPPDIEQIWTCLPTASAIQRNLRATTARRSSPAPEQSTGRTRRPDEGRLETRVDVRRRDAEIGDACFSASFHNVLRSGWPGLPSYITTVEPVSKPETSRFHIIQPVVVNQKNRSPGPRS